MSSNFSQPPPPVVPSSPLLLRQNSYDSGASSVRRSVASAAVSASQRTSRSPQSSSRGRQRPLSRTQRDRERDTHAESESARRVSQLKQFQHVVEERLDEVISALESRAAQRQADFRECELLAQHSVRLRSRYKRLTCLTVEALLELDREIEDEALRHAQYEREIRSLRREEIPALQQEMNNMRNLMALLQHFILQAEKQRSDEAVALRQQMHGGAHAV